MKDSLMKVITALTVRYAQLFQENLLQSSVKCQLKTIRYVYFVPLFSNVETAQLACLKSLTYFQ